MNLFMITPFLPFIILSLFLGISGLKSEKVFSFRAILRGGMVDKNKQPSLYWVNIFYHFLIAGTLLSWSFSLMFS